MTCLECKVIIKDEHKKLVQDFLQYEMLTEQLCREMVEETLKIFKQEEGAERPSIVLKTTMVIQ